MISGLSKRTKPMKILQMNEQKHIFYQCIVIAIVFILTNILSYLYQDNTSFTSGKGFDMEYYYEVAEQISDGEMPISKAPFVYRLGTPFLAAIASSGNLTASFKYINFAANIIIIILLAVLFSLYISNWKLRALFVSLYIVSWHAQVRLFYFYPIHTDYWALVFIFSLLIFIYYIGEKGKASLILPMALVTFIGVFFREIVLVPAAALIFINNPFKFETKPKFRLESFSGPKLTTAIPFVAGVIGLIIVHLIATPNNDYSAVYQIFKWGYRKAMFVYFLAWCIAYGPVLFLLIYNWKSALRYLTEKQYFLFYLVAFIFLSWVGGTDTLRFVYWAMPVVYILLALAIREKHSILSSYPLIALLIVTQAIAMRLFWILPDFMHEFPRQYPLLTIMSNNFRTLDLWTFHGDKFVNAVACVEYIILGSIILLWMYRREKQLGRGG